ncbi:serine hydrolase [Spirosoma sp. HMF4905]|uniref:Serine hydrolase n=1 Tax=Spirosoma arboris TaxID=2682092 RepID=A0A7K1S5C6_9BACT|nr:serine hydrolase [Spirosoma arboris]MVM29033.1 serine hydrolase [Spirosoma arboris]
MYKSLTFLLISWLVGCLITFAQPQTDTQLSTQFDKLLAEQFKPDSSGCTALVARKGKVIYQKAFGMANIELNVPMRPDHVFRIGSITKQFTAVAILQLMEQGKLSLQDEITRFIPDYPTQGKKITVEHLLTHTSGIKSYTDMKEFETIMKNDMTPTELIDFFKNQPMEFEPGTQWKYCNSGYFLLGYIIEKVSGKPYPQYLDDVFFKPLGMTSSYYGDNAKLIKNRASGYQAGKDGVDNASYLSMTQPYAAGAIVSTVGDLWKWHQAVHSYKLVKKETLDKAFTRYKLRDGKLTDYGYGWGLGTIKGSPTIAHNGGINGFLTSGTYLPREDVFVAVFSNSTAKDPGEIAERIAALALGKPFPAERKVASNVLDDYVGVYEGPFGANPKTTFTITKEDNQLFEELTGGIKMPIYPETETKFFFKAMDSQLEFIRDASGKVVKRTLTYGGQLSEAKKIK